MLPDRGLEMHSSKNYGGGGLNEAIVDLKNGLELTALSTPRRFSPRKSSLSRLKISIRIWFNCLVEKLQTMVTCFSLFKSISCHCLKHKDTKSRTCLFLHSIVLYSRRASLFSTKDLSILKSTFFTGTKVLYCSDHNFSGL